MRVPLAWLREYVDLPADPQKVAEMLAQIGFPVDAIEERPVVTGVVVGRIAQLDKHPNADRLQVGKIDVGNGALLTIATAATNVAQGQTIPVATIGAQLPQITIERRKMRGVESEGMMVSADELALPPEWFEDGIMQLEPDLDLGTDVVEYFRLSEAVLDVDITSNRVDAMSMIGLARELAAYQAVALRLPQARDVPASMAGTARASIESEDCKLFALREFSNVRVGPSPAWMRIRLALAGQRPINNLVDISNYVMLETGQPTHFYDAAKIPNKHLIARDARPGEHLQTLDGNDHELSPKDLIIASERGPEGFAGLMGGAASEVTESTTGILMEAATFTGSRVRRMSARHGFRSDASSRHEKSLPSALAVIGAQRAAELLVAQGASAGALVVEGTQDEPSRIEFPLRDVERLLGFKLAVEEVREYLDRLGFGVETKDAARLLVTSPPWRRDVSISADVVEEVARMAGYDRIEAQIPAVAQHQIRSNAYELEQRIAHTLSALGYHEIMTYALHGAQVFDRLATGATIATFPPVEVLNPLSEDQRYLRFALGTAHFEYFARIDAPVKIFEIGHIFYLENGEPLELPMVSFAFCAQPTDEPAFRDSHFLRLKGDAEALLHALTGRRDFEFAPDKRNGLHPGKTAAVLLDGREIAFLGQSDPRVATAFGVRLPVYAGGIYLENVPDYRSPLYSPPSKYPSTYRDLALICDPDLPASSIERVVARAVGETCTGVRTFDEYRGSQIAPDKKSLAVRVTMRKRDATITDEEADAAVERALGALESELGVTLRT
ncbi:MAG TPA: phenylalanine--tRNA ligase subunit beta [Candidatus Baltobacteraceae bacterium]|nr:phenylalanine--tRNA ligase subunit beta [Candidatus Baltobacteraceae bacterium]